MAAAVAAAGPLPQPKQEAEPVPAGRGAEGALGTLGAWQPVRSAPVLAMFDMWQNKPLAQARQAAAAAAGGGGGFVKEEPTQQLQPVKQEQQHPQQQQAQLPPPRQPQQQQLQQRAVVQQLQFPSDGAPPTSLLLQPGYFTRPPSAGPAGTPPSGALAALQAAVGTAPIPAWALGDVADCLVFLRKQGEQQSRLGWRGLQSVAWSRGFDIAGHAMHGCRWNMCCVPGKVAHGV